MKEEPKNPFEQPGTEAAPKKETSRRTLFVAAFLILLLDVTSREIARSALIRSLTSTSEIGTFMTLVSIGGFVGPILGAVLASSFGFRMAIIAGAAAGAAGELAALAGLPHLVLLASIGRGMIATPIYVLIGRTVREEPEIRDSWFAGSTVTATIGGLIGGLGMYIGAFVGGTFAYAVAAAVILAIIPIALAMIEEPSRTESDATPARVPALLLGIAVVLAALGSLRDGVTFAHSPLRGGTWVIVAQSAFTLFGGIVAAMVYLARHFPGREDAAHKKLAIGAVGAALAAALLLITPAENSPAIFASTFFDRVAALMIYPIAIGVAATQRPASAALFIVAAWSTVQGLVTAGAMALAPQMENEVPLMAFAAIVSLALAAVLWFRTDSRTR